jgi:hypothetical protein
MHNHWPCRFIKVVKITVRKFWPEVASLWVGSDVDTAMACLETFVGLKVIVIGGTGSNCFGQDQNFKSSLGGFGHLLGKLFFVGQCIHTKVKLVDKYFKVIEAPVMPLL